jgi:2-polyprenyl-6-methoxyphenol hydroxylase-like FAD-dependent oxidoreductase
MFMKKEFSHYESDIQQILEYVARAGPECRIGAKLIGISLAEDVKRWPLFIQKPFSTWVNRRIVLIGDAAHPVLL